MVASGAAPQAGRTVTERTFPAPFDFVSAAIFADHVPASPARKTLNVALAALGIILPLGLLAIYQSVRSVVDLSERRSQFVSSVTHELKTPLTNIRMYVEMLEQGIAATPEREQEYLGIIGSESGRLSRLINNVLELSKLEKKQRIVQLRHAPFGEVVDEVRSVMSPKLAREGFELTVTADADIAFAYDREAMLQILINLIENSVKFGRGGTRRQIRLGAEVQGEWVHISVADTGPGIPRHALKRIFDDFYRADSALTRTTSGTGIGLALVKKLAAAMGGRVQAFNNPDGGCTIAVRLPFNTRPST
jgi:signal transduction histidine kinase